MEMEILGLGFGWKFEVDYEKFGFERIWTFGN